MAPNPVIKLIFFSSSEIPIGRDCGPIFPIVISLIDSLRMSHLPFTLLKSKSFRSCMAAATAVTAATGDWGTAGPPLLLPGVCEAGGSGGGGGGGGATVVGPLPALQLATLVPFSVSELDTLMRGVSDRMAAAAATAADPINDWDTLIAGWCGVEEPPFKLSLLGDGWWWSDDEPDECCCCWFCC